MYWKSQLPFVKVLLSDSTDKQYLLIVNKNYELQKIYFGVSKTELKSIAERRRHSIDFKLKQTEEQLYKSKQADYEFIDKKTQEERTEDKSKLVFGSHDALNVKRLTLSDKAQGRQNDFLGLPGIGFSFDQFAQEMLQQPSSAKNILDLHLEITQDYSRGSNVRGDVHMSEAIDQNQLISLLDSELEAAFTNLMKLQ